MSKPQDYRRVSRNACTWCGHRKHRAACKSTIRLTVGKSAQYGPCPCRRHAVTSPTSPGEAVSR